MREQRGSTDSEDNARKLLMVLGGPEWHDSLFVRSALDLVQRGESEFDRTLCSRLAVTAPACG